MDAAHRSAGLDIVEPARYFGSSAIGALNLQRALRGWWRPLRRVAVALLLAGQQAICDPPESQYVSPWIVGLYRRPHGLGQPARWSE